MTGPHRNADQLDRLLHEVVRDRAGDPPPPPADDVLDGLRTRGAARRRRRSRLVAVAATAVVVVAGAVVGLARLPDSDTDADRLEVIDEPTTAPSTTTTTPTTTSSPSTTAPPSTAPDTSTTVAPDDPGGPGDSDGSVAGPAIGASAEVYVGVSYVTHTDDGQLWTADGRSLDYLTMSGDRDLRGVGRVVTVFDGDHAMLWLLEPGGTAEAGTVVDAVDLPASAADVDVGLGGGCTAATTDAAVVALVRRPAEGGAVTVLQAWTVEPAASGAALEPLASVDGVECTGFAGE